MNGILVFFHFYGHFKELNIISMLIRYLHFFLKFASINLLQNYHLFTVVNYNYYLSVTINITIIFTIIITNIVIFRKSIIYNNRFDHFVELDRVRYDVELTVNRNSGKKSTDEKVIDVHSEKKVDTQIGSHLVAITVLVRFLQLSRIAS